MKLIGTCCYSQLVYLMCAGAPFQRAVHSINFKEPRFDFEGIAGFIETEYTIEVKDLKAFTNIWESWYSLSDKRSLDLYGLAKGLGDCK